MITRTHTVTYTHAHHPVHICIIYVCTYIYIYMCVCVCAYGCATKKFNLPEHTYGICTSTNESVWSRNPDPDRTTVCFWAQTGVVGTQGLAGDPRPACAAEHSHAATLQGTLYYDPWQNVWKADTCSQRAVCYMLLICHTLHTFTYMSIVVLGPVQRDITKWVHEWVWSSKVPICFVHAFPRQDSHMFGGKIHTMFGWGYMVFFQPLKPLHGRLCCSCWSWWSWVSWQWIWRCLQIWVPSTHLFGIIWIWFSIVNHPFLSSIVFGNLHTHINTYIYMFVCVHIIGIYLYIYIYIYIYTYNVHMYSVVEFVSVCRVQSSKLIASV